MLSSNEFYDSIVSHYNTLSFRRLAYLEAVDSLLVCTTASHNINSWLDVGTGNGTRLSSLLGSIHATSVVCIEPSIRMAQSAEGILPPNASIHITDFDTFSASTSTKYDLITALWNVVGHYGRPVKFIRTAFQLLAPGGHLFIDVNNRHNFRQYGFLNVIRNLLSELPIIRSSSSNFFEHRYKIHGKDINTNVYISSPAELHFAASCLAASHTQLSFLNYETGGKATRFTGQIVLIIRK
jgi:2-polyprenyl-3-methyl-5-hydroxy-6-metoxy-1,4-benzoquinol methylase